MAVLGLEVKRGGDALSRSITASQREDYLVRLIFLIGKLYWTSARELAVLKSCILHVTMFQEELQLMDNAKEVMIAYANHVDTLSQQEGALFSSPHVLVWWEAMVFAQAQATKNMM